MDSITIENFRCFGERQTVRLAPLTLLVGENSTGKTSFLALVRALWDMAYASRVPDFKEYPFDLGGFDEIVHNPGAWGSAIDTIDAEFKLNPDRFPMGAPNHFSFSLAKDRAAPTPEVRRRSRGGTWTSETLPPTKPYSLTVGTNRGVWQLRETDELQASREGYSAQLAWSIFSGNSRFRLDDFTAANGSPTMRQDDFEKVRSVSAFLLPISSARPFAGAPIRSETIRTYDSSRIDVDPEGDHIPMYLAEAKANDAETWAYLKQRLEHFAGPAGLFDEIDVKQFAGFGGPFQIRVKMHEGRSTGPWRNIVDVGYGVSQVLPVLTELIRPDAPETFLFQQPEVHLHPMAQATLGSMFCQVVGAGEPRRQLIVETHSDHLINRVRMDVRDAVGGLTPDDVVVLYFERRDSDVKIHEITFDELGNLDGAPPSYGRFFMDEMNRNLWPGDYTAVK